MLLNAVCGLSKKQNVELKNIVFKQSPLFLITLSFSQNCLLYWLVKHKIGLGTAEIWKAFHLGNQESTDGQKEIRSSQNSVGHVGFALQCRGIRN